MPLKIAHPPNSKRINPCKSVSQIEGITLYVIYNEKELNNKSDNNDREQC